MQTVRACIVFGLFLGFLILGQPVAVSAETVKTYVKQYSIFSFDGQDYLCEPYQVKKDDWLYKIFRKKGEISGRDFPRFLKIFRQLNPKLSNIDAIEPGHQILIPLREVSRDAYEKKDLNLVEVPVLEFSDSFGDDRLASFAHPHTIQPGDTVSDLLDRAFRRKGGAVSDTGKKVFQQLNPDIRDIDRIYLGSRVLIPDPAILNQPWFQEFLAADTISPLDRQNLAAQQEPRAALPTLPELPPEDLVRLKRYVQLVQGTLQHQGKMVFPGKQNQPDQVLNLSKTPVITDKEGKKKLILPSPISQSQISSDLLKGIKAYWKELQIQELNQALADSSFFSSASKTLDQVPKDLQVLIDKSVSATSFSMQPATKITVRVGAVDMDISLARIVHPGQPDVLINPGNVFGMALDALAEKGYQIITFSPHMTESEILLLLFSKLGYTTWKDPSVNAGGQVTLLKGVYAVRQEEKVFITRSDLSDKATAFLTAEGVNLIQL